MSNIINIQLYQKATDNTGTEADLQQIIETIAGRTGASANIEQRIINIRKYKEAIFHLEENLKRDPDEKEATWKKFLKERTEYYEDLKKGLPAVTWSGTFTKRAAKHLKQYSGLICIDIDKLQLEELKALYAKIKNDPHTFICFVSPSGNGIKVIFKVASTADQHKDCFIAIEKYFVDTYQVQIDPSGKDVSRLCFLSYSKKLYHNPGCTAFVLPTVEPEIKEAEKKKLSTATAKEKKQLQESGQDCNDMYESTLLVRDYREPSGPNDVKAGRNNFIFKYACNCNRVGISQLDCSAFAYSFATDKSHKEIDDTVKSAYTHNAAEHGKYQRKTPATGSGKNKSNTPVVAKNGQQPKPVNGVKIDHQFWKEIKFKKGKGDDAYWVSRYELVRREFRKFLSSQGFNLMRTGEKGYEMVQHGSGIIKPVLPEDIKHFVIDWSQQNKLEEVEEMILKGQKNYFSMAELNSLPYQEFNIAKDNADTSRFFFNNCWVSVTGNVYTDTEAKIQTHGYNAISDFIWEANKIKHDYVHQHLDFLDPETHLMLPIEKMPCEFARFVALASYNPNNEDESDFDIKIKTERFISFCTSIGFLLDGYKHPSNRLGIFSVDHKIAEDRSEANGRTGKSLIPQACEQLKRVANIGGKTFDPRYQFAYEAITVDTQIINFNDMRAGFDVENIFEFIADNYSVNRRNNGFIHFKYINSPKVYYSTNSIPKGDGSSYRARMHTLEFCDYFSDEHSPFQEFGHGFFDDGWDKQEWQRFFNFMLWCVCLYKVKGLVTYPNPNFEKRKLITEVVPEFIDFLCDPHYVMLNHRTPKIDLLNTYNDKFHQPLYNNKLKPHTFAKWVKQVCKNKGFRFNPHKKGSFDKSNSTEYYTIADVNFEKQQTLL